MRSCSSLFRLFSSFRSFAGSLHTKPASLRFRPSLEVLEDRTVPAVVDLTTPGAQGTVNGALFQENTGDKGSNGIFQPFVRLAVNQTNTAQGYNTDARPLQFDEKQGPYTHSVQVSDVPIVAVNGATYREFVVNIDPSGSDPVMSLDEFRLYLGSAPNLTGYNPCSKQLAGLSPLYDLDAGGDNTVLLNGALKPGHDTGDARVLVPTSVLTSPGNSYVYLYSKFGVTVPATGGYESWVIRPGSGAATSPAPASVSGYVLDNTGAGISGATLTLTGKTTSGQSVNLTFTSNPDGSYTFTNLQPGTYSVSETPPPPYVESGASVGTVTTPTQPNPSFDGTLGTTGSIDQIVLGSGTVGVNYDFTDVIPGG